MAGNVGAGPGSRVRWAYRSGALAAICALGAAGLQQGCLPPKPWQGVDARGHAQVLHERNVGLAYLENGATPTDGQGPPFAPQAIPHFVAIQKMQPALALGYANEAVTRLFLASNPLPPEMDTAKNLEKAGELAQEAIRRDPGDAALHLILAQVRAQQHDTPGALQEFDAALRLDPNNSRAAMRLLELSRNDSSVPAANALAAARALSRNFGRNPVAQWQAAMAEARVGTAPAALAALDRLHALVGDSIPQASEYFQRARTVLQAGDAPAAVGPLTMLGNVMKPRCFWQQLGAELDVPGDPADLAVREFHPAPPSFAASPPSEVEVHFTDQTAALGLGPGAGKHGAPSFTSGSRTSRPPALPADHPVAAGDFRGDHFPDLVVAGGAHLANEHGRFKSAAPPGGGATSVYAVDMDTDFQLDLYEVRPDGDRWLPYRNGIFGPPHPVAPGARGPGTALFVDLDQDGDLDVLRATADRGLRYLRNNGNLTFTDITASTGLQAIRGGVRQVLSFDFDNDGDPDLLVITAAGEVQLWENLRQDRFREVSAAHGLNFKNAWSAAIADVDRDGWFDVLITGSTASQSALFKNRGGMFQRDDSIGPKLARWSRVQPRFFDYDNDGWQDLLVVGTPTSAAGSGAGLFRGPGWQDVSNILPRLPPAATALPLDHDNDGNTDLLVTLADGSLRLLRSEGANRNGWSRVTLRASDKLDANRVTRQNDCRANNAFGIGATVEMIAGQQRQKLLVTDPETMIGLGAARKPDAFRVVWTNGVPENYIEPTIDGALVLEQHLAVSCPFLYAWDGEKYAFVTDCNWLSPLGMIFARGAPIPHVQTQDRVRVPGSLLKPVDGVYHLTFTEELNEVSYLDWAQLVAVDHPVGTEIYLDEKMKLGPNRPLRVYGVRHPRVPVSARNERGEDLLPVLRSLDGAYTDDFPTGPIRGIAPPHDLVLDLGHVANPADVRLFLNGWVYPSSSSGNVAASQDPAMPVIPPRVAVPDAHGRWKTVLPSIGFPAGKRKTIVIDLSDKFLARDYRVRLTTTMELRWDAAWFVSGEAPVPMRLHALDITGAELAYHGYSTRVSAKSGPDLFRYEPADRRPRWIPILGRYTRYGDVLPLLRAVDDRYVIVGPGDEVHMEFDGRRLPPLPPGWKRDYVFASDGWTKDNNPNTVTGQTVEPLPFHAMRTYPPGPGEREPQTKDWRSDRRMYHTRAVTSVDLPPLRQPR